MGIVRILLALSVVAVHLPPYKFSPILGAIAVPLFCAISGYLVSYTLTSSSKYSQISMLYLNKVLRLYAIILCRCALLSAYVLVGAIWLANFEGLQSIDHLLLPIVNITFLVKIGSFFSVLTEPYLAPQRILMIRIFLPEFLLDGLSWTFGAEFTFCLIEPFVLRRRVWIFSLLVGSLIARVIAVRLGASPS